MTADRQARASTCRSPGDPSAALARSRRDQCDTTRSTPPEQLLLAYHVEDRAPGSPGAARPHTGNAIDVRGRLGGVHILRRDPLHRIPGCWFLKDSRMLHYLHDRAGSPSSAGTGTASGGSRAASRSGASPASQWQPAAIPSAYSAPRPAELLLAAQAGCTALDVASILAKKRQSFRSYEVSVTGDQRDDRPPARLSGDRDRRRVRWGGHPPGRGPAGDRAVGDPLLHRVGDVQHRTRRDQPPLPCPV